MTTTQNIREVLTLTVPKEIAEDLDKIARFNDKTTEELVFSYIVEGVASDSHDARRIKFAEKATQALGKGTDKAKTIDDIFENMLY